MCDQTCNLTQASLCLTQPYNGLTQPYLCLNWSSQAKAVESCLNELSEFAEELKQVVESQDGLEEFQADACVMLDELAEIVEAAADGSLGRKNLDYLKRRALGRAAAAAASRPRWKNYLPKPIWSPGVQDKLQRQMRDILPACTEFSRLGLNPG